MAFMQQYLSKVNIIHHKLLDRQTSTSAAKPLSVLKWIQTVTLIKWHCVCQWTIFVLCSAVVWGQACRTQSATALAHYWHAWWCVVAECILCLAPTKANQCTWEWVLINSVNTRMVWEHIGLLSIVWHSSVWTLDNTQCILITFSFAVDLVKFGPPLRKVTEPYPDLVMHFFCKIFICQCCLVIAYMNIHESDQRFCSGSHFSRSLMMMTGVCLEMKTAHRKTSLFYLHSVLRILWFVNVEVSQVYLMPPLKWLIVNLRTIMEKLPRFPSFVKDTLWFLKIFSKSAPKSKDFLPALWNMLISKSPAVYRAWIC